MIACLLVRSELTAKFAQGAVEALALWPLLSFAIREHQTTFGHFKKVFFYIPTIGICHQWIAFSMCPTYPRSRAPIDIRIFAVIRTPRDYIVHVAYLRYFFRHKESCTIKCSECYTKTKRKIIKGSYVLRHSLGFPECFESCNVCSILTVTLHVIASCSDCSEVLKRFAAYVGRTEEQLWNDSESTIIGIFSSHF